MQPHTAAGEVLLTLVFSLVILFSVNVLLDPMIPICKNK